MARIYSRKEKENVRDAIRALHEKSGLSAAEFASRVGFTNASILSQMYTNLDFIGEKAMETALKYIAKSKYVGVVTENYMAVFNALESAYHLKNVQVIVGNGGYGKSFAIDKYREEKEREGRRVYVVNLEGVHTKKGFIRIVCQGLGMKFSPRTTMREMIAEIREYMRRKDALLVVDEASALEGRKVTIIKDLMTALRGTCGVAFAGTPYFLNNITRHAMKDDHLFSELADRLPMLPVVLKAPTDEEAEAIFRANGCDDAEVDTLMGKAGERYKWLCWRNKPTFRGVADAIDFVKTVGSVPPVKKQHLTPII